MAPDRTPAEKLERQDIERVLKDLRAVLTILERDGVPDDADLGGVLPKLEQALETLKLLA